jgi:HEAT repeat protein
VDELFAGKSINRWIHELNYQDTGRRAERALIRIGAPAVPGLIRKADAESPIMHAAIYILSRIDDPLAFEALIAKLAHSNASVRLAAAYVLGKSGDQRAAKVLLDALLRENTTTQSTLARALADIGDLSVVEPMIGYLNDKLSDLLPKTVLVSVQGRNMDPVLGVIDALGQMMDSRAVNSLVIALEKGDHLVRQASARALGRIKDPDSVGALIQALDYEYVGSYAAQALGEIGDPGAVEALKLAADKGSISRIDLKNALKAIQIRPGDNEG